jgi:hypothetical protein
MPRPATTLILLTPHRIVRGDFAAGTPTTVVDLTVDPRPETDELPLVVEVALAHGPAIGKNVYLLSQDLFTHNLKLDAKAFGLGGAELVGALAFEAEPYSGLNHFDATTAFVQLSAQAGEREFWVTQIRTSDLEQCRDVVAEAGGRLKSVLPAGDVPDGPALPRNVEDREAVSAWLGAWAEKLANKKLEMPLLVPPVRPMSPAQRNLVSALFALFVVAMCGAHYFLWYERVSGELAAQKRKYEVAQQNLAEIDKKAQDFDKKRQEQTQKNDADAKTLAAVTMQRERLGKLLVTLAGEAHDGLLVRKIDSANGEVVLRGWCLDPKSPAQLAHNLGGPSADLAWKAESPKSKAQYKLPGGGPWEFELQLRDQLVSDVPAANSGRKSR